MGIVHIIGKMSHSKSKIFVFLIPKIFIGDYNEFIINERKVLIISRNYINLTQTQPRRVPRKNVTKTDIYWGLYRIRIFIFLTLLRTFVPRLEIFLRINNYFLVFIFKYRTSSRVNFGL